MPRAAGKRKRAFERRGGVLRDEYRGADRRRIVSEMPASTAGEPVPAGERDTLRARIGGDDEGLAAHAMYALSGEHSPQMLEQLLIALAKRNWLAPMKLVRYADDPRVQPALLDAVKTVPLEQLANFAQVLGMLGGPGARDALRARMHEALAHPQAFAPHEFFNDLAGAATTCAEHLLDLDAEDQDAADALVRLTDHACGRNRRSAAWRAAESLQRHRGVHTKPMRDLRARLTALIDTPDDDVFCVVAPVLWDDPRVPVRVEKLLEARSPAKQHLALRVLQEIDFPGWPLLIAWGSRPRDPLLVLTELGPHMRLLPEARRAEIARHSLAHESPTLRREAAAVLGSLDETVAAKVARAALRDEPDPIIRARLLALVKPPRRRAKRPPARGAARPGRRRP